MAYSEQTSIAHAADLIARIVNFASSNGWTTHRNVESGGLRSATLRKAGSSDYVHLYNEDNDVVRVRLSVGFDELLPPQEQPNVADGDSLCTLEEGPYPKAFLFASGDMVWVTVAIARSGEYRHLTFGVVDKIGSYPGGTYCDGSEWGQNGYWATLSRNRAPFMTYASESSSGMIRADSDGRTNQFFYSNGTGYPETPDLVVSDISGGGGWEGVTSSMVERADKNAFSGRSVFHAIPLYVSRTGSQTYYSPAGVVHDVRYCSINKFEPEQEVSIASDVYKVFPVAGKRATNSDVGEQPAASDDFAYAIRKVP